MSLRGDADDDAGLSFLIDDIQQSTFLLESATQLFMEQEKSVVYDLDVSPDQKYLEVMKPLQFGELNFILTQKRFKIISLDFPHRLVRHRGRVGRERLQVHSCLSF